MTRDILQNMILQMQKGSKSINLHQVSPEMVVDGILSQMDMTDVPENLKPEMKEVKDRFREDLTAYFTILQKAKEQIK